MKESDAMHLGPDGRDPYQPPDADLLGGPHPMMEGTPWLGDPALLAAFVGPRWETYARKWRALERTGAAYGGFCWPAFLFGAFWFVYRRMYATGSVIFLIYVLIQSMIMQLDTAPDDTYGNGLSFGLSVALGLTGHLLYFRFAQRTLGHIAAEPIERDQQLSAAARRGGTSLAAVLMLAFVTIASVLIVELGP